VTSSADKSKGRAKKAAGEATGDRRLKREGSADKASGGLKRGIDRVRNLLTGKRR
jgi:uncharacterized protein YjbJ (UPF0337 family)